MKGKYMSPTIKYTIAIGITFIAIFAIIKFAEWILGT